METEGILMALIVVDVTATLAGNFILWQIVMGQEKRLSRLEGQHEQNHRRPIAE